jgi:hypothetical protein
VPAAQVAVDDVTVRLDGEAARSETTVSLAGPWALTPIMVVTELGVQLISGYIGGQRIATAPRTR